MELVILSTLWTGRGRQLPIVVLCRFCALDVELESERAGEPLLVFSLLFFMSRFSEETG